MNDVTQKFEIVQLFDIRPNLDCKENSKVGK